MHSCAYIHTYMPTIHTCTYIHSRNFTDMWLGLDWNVLDSVQVRMNGWMRRDCSKYSLHVYVEGCSVRVLCRLEALVRLGELQCIVWRWSPAEDQILHKTSCRRMRRRRYGNEKLQFLQLQGRYIFTSNTIIVAYTSRHKNPNRGLYRTHTYNLYMDFRRCSLFISLFFL